MSIEKNKSLRDQFKTETHGEYEEIGEFNYPTWEYVFWLEKALLSATKKGTPKNNNKKTCGNCRHTTRSCAEKWKNIVCKAWQT